MSEVRLIDADDFFRTFEELDSEPYNNFPTVEISDDCERAYQQGYHLGFMRGADRPKGEWEIIDAEDGKIWNCICTECGHDPQEYIGGTENWWLRKPLPNFCPNCGARIVNTRGDV